MKTLSIDIETFSSVDLQKSGVYKYAEADGFEILLFGYSIDGSEVQVVDLANGEKLPRKVINALTDPTATKWAHNSAFERVCLSKWLGLPKGQYLNPKSWHCTMVWSAYMGLPLSLEGVGAVLGLEKQKLKEGKDLIRYFCKPCNPTASNGNRDRNLPYHAPDKWTAFKEYNKRDVETEMAIQEKLAKFPVPQGIWGEYHLDQEINDCGVMLDMQFVKKAIKADELTKSKLTAKMEILTGLENPNSVAQMKEWLAENGLETDSLDKQAVSEMLITAPKPLKEVLSFRQQLSKSSVAKYTAMENAVCADSRVRGIFQFYGANRTGRWSGRILQPQNLPRNNMPDLKQARHIVKSGDYPLLEMLYDSVPDVLSQLIRTAFVPKDGYKFIVADFSAIEARVIAWLAGEKWRIEAFKKGEDIYCEAAEKMFDVPVVKNGLNGHLRQKGKIAELACIAEGQLVLTDRGLVPIEKVTMNHKLWDGENWVKHEGVVYKGIKEVIDYEGLTATKDHLVWVEGKQEPIHFGVAATSGAHLVQTGNGRQAIRLGKDNQSREKMEQSKESLLCANQVYRMQQYPMDQLKQFTAWYIKRMSTLFSTKANPSLARQTLYSGKAAMRKSKRPQLSQLWRTRNKVRLFECDCGRAIYDSKIWTSRSFNGNRQNRYKWRLFTRKPAIWDSPSKLHQSTKVCPAAIHSRVLAICTTGSCSKTIARSQSIRDYSRCRESSIRKTEELAHHKRTARLYDIRNAGEHHRFTVSGKLVHNCSYGGSVGALKAMGALEMGLAEDELKPLVTAWRSANPNITKLWWDVDRAAMTAVREKTTAQSHGIRFSYQSGMLFITLPSGRRLAYVKPRIGENRFGGSCVTYEGIGMAKKWERIESYGPKFVENIVQAIARDILAEAMTRLNDAGHEIVMHIHDEVVIEAPTDITIDNVCSIMTQTPSWAKGLLLGAEGFECEFYKKD